MPTDANRYQHSRPNDGTMLFVIAVILCLLLGGGYSYYHYRTARIRELQRMEAQQRAYMEAKKRAEAERMAAQALSSESDNAETSEGPVGSDHSRDSESTQETKVTESADTDPPLEE